MDASGFEQLLARCTIILCCAIRLLSQLLHASQQYARLPCASSCGYTLLLFVQVLGVRLAADAEEHVCVNHCWLFDKVPQCDWKFHRDEQCPKCHELRFRIVSCGTGRKPRLLPQRRFWDLGLETVIHDLFFSNPN